MKRWSATPRATITARIKGTTSGPTSEVAPLKRKRPEHDVDREHDAERDAERRHPSTPPNRRSRRWYSPIASKSSSRRKSGQSTSVKTSSEYASSQSRKLEIRYSPRRADHEVRVGQLGVVEPLGDSLLVDLLRRHLVGDELAHGVNDLGASAVVEGDVERQDLVIPRRLLGPVHARKDALRDAPVAAPREDDSYAVGVELALAAVEEVPVEVHEVAHLLDRSAPVLGREREDREDLHPRGDGPVGDVDEGLLAGPVALGSRQSPTPRPAAAAVHHDGDVTRHAVGSQEPRKGCGARIGHEKNLLRSTKNSASRSVER